MERIDKSTLIKMLDINSDNELRAFDELDNIDTSFEYLTGIEMEKEIVAQIQRNKKDNKVVDVEERNVVWENGWSENLAELVKTKNIDSLMPKYFRKDQAFRLFQRFIRSTNYKLDFELGRVIKKCFFELYLKSFDSIYEFGCGTGFNLIELAKLFPEKELFGLDYTQASVDILKILHDDFNYNISGGKFDFFNPNLKFHLNENSAVYTIAALEQVGSRWGEFLDYLINEKPGIVMHLEPIAEFYESETRILDNLALEFHTQRHYLQGYYTKLLELEKEGVIEVIDAHRTWFGNLNDESYSLVVWKPV